MSDTANKASPHGAHDEHGDPYAHIHVSSWQTLVAVFVALVLLTSLTVYVATYDIGRFELAVAMGIATIKCALVMGFFMHLKYDRALNRMVFLGSILFFTLFLGITVIDLDSSKPDIESYRRENPVKTAPATEESKPSGEATKPGDPKKSGEPGQHQKQK